MRAAATVIITALLTAAVGAPALADHLPPQTVIPSPLAGDVPVLATGDVRFIANVQAAASPAAPLGEAGPFAREGRSYFAASSMLYGLHVVDVTDPFAPSVVSSYAAASGCPTATAETWSGGNRDAFAPIGGWENDQSVTPDGSIAVLGADAAGRCHDPHHGGLEFIDLSDLEHPRTLHLTRNVGEAHSVTIDPERPHLAYLSSSDGADFIDVVDFSSCAGGPAACDVTVARIPFTPEQFPDLPIGTNGTDLATSGCHDIRFQGDLLYCAAVGSSLIMDVSGILDPDGVLTGTHLTAGSDACEILPATRTDAGVSVTDCTNWTEDLFASTGAQGAAVELLSFIDHDGSKPPSQDIDVAHQAEPTHDGSMMFVTDERGGGLTNASGCPGGGARFFDIRDKRNPVPMQLPDGAPAIYRTEVNLPGTAHMSCTIHYGEQVGEENLFVFGWYLNGTRVVRVTPDWSTSPATVTFEEVAAYLPAGGMSIQAKPLLRNPSDPDELIVLSGDLTRGLDVLGVRAEAIALPAPPRPTKVLSAGSQRSLPATGAADATPAVLLLLAAAAFITRRLRSV